MSRLCAVLRVSRAGFYAWRSRSPSARQVEDEKLRILVREAHLRARRTYGSPRIHRALQRQEIRISRKRVIRLMQSEGLEARARRRYRCTTMSDHEQPVAANLLGREFNAAAPNERWIGDTTELLIPGGRLFLAVIVDLYSRFVVGWALSAVNDRHLTIRALDMALRRRCPDAGLLHHSDQGSTGGFNRPSQRLDMEGLRWEQRGVVGQLGRGVLRCVHQGALRRGDVSTGNGSGRRYESGSPAKTLRS